jgi:hypothetical protein
VACHIPRRTQLIVLLHTGTHVLLQWTALCGPPVGPKQPTAHTRPIARPILGATADMVMQRAGIAAQNVSVVPSD